MDERVLQKCMRAAHKSPPTRIQTPFRPLPPWHGGFFHEFVMKCGVDKYENINIEHVDGVLLYELTHLIC